MNEKIDSSNNKWSPQQLYGSENQMFFSMKAFQEASSLPWLETEWLETWFSKTLQVGILLMWEWLT